MKSLVSVIIPAFDRRALLAEAVESLRRQTYPAWEAVVVDDGSSDGTQRFVETLAAADPRIRLLNRSREPKGAPTCRNLGLAAAGGEFVVFLDSDDLLAPGCLAGRGQVMRENPDLDFAVFQTLLFRTVAEEAGLLWNLGSEEPDLCRFARGDSVWPINGAVWRRGFLNRLAGCDESLTCWQDVDLHIRALALKPRYLKRLEGEPDSFVRHHAGGSISQRGLACPEAIRSRMRVCQKATEALAADSRQWRPSLLAAWLRLLDVGLGARQFGLCRDILNTARDEGLLSVRQRRLWDFIVASYQVRLQDLVGARWLKRKLMAQSPCGLTLGCQPYRRPAAPAAA